MTDGCSRYILQAQKASSVFILVTPILTKWDDIDDDDDDDDGDDDDDVMMVMMMMMMMMMMMFDCSIFLGGH